MPRVLVVEDEPLIALMVQDWLTELGCETVGPANTVQDALTLIDGQAQDAAILDVSLGKQDCYPVADALRTRGVPIALATGHSLDGPAAGYAEALSLSKPYDFEAAKGTLAKLLNGPART